VEALILFVSCFKENKFNLKVLCIYIYIYIYIGTAKYMQYNQQNSIIFILCLLL